MSMIKAVERVIEQHSKQLKEQGSNKSTGSFTCTLPNSIPSTPKNFVANDIRMGGPTNGFGPSFAAYQDLPPNYRWCDFLFPAGLTVGSYEVSPTPGDSNRVLTIFTDWSDGVLVYLGYTGKVNVTYWSEAQKHLSATFEWKTVGGRLFSGEFDIYGFVEGS